jgi:release factor glutamine methyltransferase
MPITIKELTISGLKDLADFSTPLVDVEILLAHVLDCSQVFLKTYPEKEVPQAKVEAFTTAINRRVQGEPIAYIIGIKNFWTFTVTVSPDVLIPRPETEILVEKTLEKIAQDNHKNAINILDLGTGSGVIAIALALEVPIAQIFAIDAAAAAITLAKLNTKNNGINNISFYQGDWFSPVVHMREKFAYIVSNPPYISSKDPHLNNKELTFEPQQALIAGDDGLRDLAVIIAQGWNFLTQGGWLMVEHGYDQVTKVKDLFVNNNYSDIASYKDLAGHFRVTCGCKL